MVAQAERIRAVGTRHSFNGIADSAGDMLDLSALPMAPALDQATGEVTIGSRTRYGDLAGWLESQGRALHNMGSLPHISVAGAGRPAYEIIEAQVAAQQNPEAVRKEVASINGSLKNGKEVSDVPAYLQSLYRASVQPYLISWFKYNPRTVIASVKVPVLIVQGKNDIQVSVEDAELLKKGCPAAELLLIDKMNHVLKDCESKAVQQQMLTYGNPSLPVNSTLIASVSTFVKKLK